MSADGQYRVVCYMCAYFLIALPIYIYMCVCLFFFFSSRRRHTRFTSDWSSDVCSSDLRAGNASLEEIVMALSTRRDFFDLYTEVETRQIVPTSRLVSRLMGIGVSPNKAVVGANAFAHRSEERRVGKECRSRWSPYD